MAAKDDGANSREEGDQRIMDLVLQAAYKGTGKGKGSLGKGQRWNEKRSGKGGNDTNRGGKNS